MRTRVLLALLLLSAAIGPASAQQTQRGGVRTETESRLEQGTDADLFWNLIGLLGLLGLIGLHVPHEEDSYHPSALQ